MLLHVHIDRTIRDREPWTAILTFTQLLGSDRVISKFSVALRPETTRTIMDGESRTATSTFTQLLSFTDTTRTIKEAGSPGSNHDCYTAPEL